MQGLVPLDHLLSESSEGFAFETAKQLDDVSSNFERSCFKIESPGGKNEAKINVYQPTIMYID